MPVRNLVVLTVVLLGLTACLGRLTSSEPSRYYEVDYQYKSAGCMNHCNKAVKIWHFSAAAPYERDEMIILDNSRQVRFSPQLRWIALPGTMISDRLLQDLSHARLFSRAVGTGDPSNPPLQLGGHVFRFAWEEDDSTAHAVLDVEVSLWSKEPKSDILLRKHYHLESEPVPVGSSEGFAEAMSGLVRQMSMQLQQDLCPILKDNLSPAGD
ncbi:MAG: ABC-type transport auxiliary lipoprotein family protein [Syntrophobacteraceae bacterium]